MDISRGGTTGSVIGTLASFLFHKKNDSLPKKAIKTGILGGIGYLLGTLIERKFSQTNKK